MSTDDFLRLKKAFESQYRCYNNCRGDYEYQPTVVIRLESGSFLLGGESHEYTREFYNFMKAILRKKGFSD